MSVAMLLKIFSDCCIVFAILGSGPVTFEIPLLIPALICGTAVAIATFLEEKRLSGLRRLCCVLPFTCLLMVEGTAQMLVLAAPAAYAAFVILQGKLELEYAGYRHFFIRSLVLLVIVYAVANIWIFLTQITSETVVKLDPSVILRYGLVHLMCGVILQRQLRLGVGARAEGGRRQVVMLLATAGAIVAGFLAAEPLLRKGIGTVMRAVITLIFAPFVLLFELAAWLIARLDSDGSDQKTYEEFVKYMESIGLGGGAGAGQAPQRPVEDGLDVNTLWMVLAVMIFVVAAALLLRSFYKRRADSDHTEVSVRPITAPKKKKAPYMSNRSRVRQVYRDFLRTEKAMGMSLKSCDTSADVLDRIHKDTDRPSAEQLREVYLVARYDDRQNISRNQVEHARRMLKGARRSK